MQTQQTIALLTPERDLDVSSVDELRSQIDTLIDGGCRRLVLNMSKVTYVDSSGVSLLLRELRRMRSLGGLLSLSCVSDEVFYALRLMRLVDLMPVSALNQQAFPELDAGVLPLSTISFSINLKNMCDARAKLEAYLENKELGKDEVFDLKLAAGEALGNAFDHARAQNVLLTVLMYQDRVVLEIDDDGCGFELEDDECPCLSPTDERGRGIRLMRLLMDSVSISRRSQFCGTEVRLIKLLHM